MPTPLRIIVALLGLVLLSLPMAGCKASGLRAQADRADRLADTADNAADALDRSFVNAQAALDWAADPVNSALVDLFPPTVRLRYDRAIAAGEDLRPVLAEGTLAIRGFGPILRDSADTLRIQADAEQSDLANFLAALGIAATGAGGIGAVIGRLLGIGAGAAGVTRVVNKGRKESELFDAAFEGPAGKAMKQALADQPKAVRDAVKSAKL